MKLFVILFSLVLVSSCFGGIIKMSVVTDAKVYLDGKSVETVPFRLLVDDGHVLHIAIVRCVKKGHHRVKFVDCETGKSDTHSFNVSSNKEILYYLSFNCKKISFSFGVKLERKLYSPSCCTHHYLGHPRTIHIPRKPKRNIKSKKRKFGGVVKPNWR